MSTAFIIGVDDTDNLESRGTGFRVREMVVNIRQKGLAEIAMIARHQLLVSPDIPYTSHNSSASITGNTKDINILFEFCEQYLSENSAPGSDAGLCLTELDNVAEVVVQWGYRAKKEVLTMEEACNLASRQGILLKGVTGERTGIIGALAAVGLRKNTSDGRVLWMPGLREMKGIITAGKLLKDIPINRIENLNGDFIPLSSRVDLGEWFRPVLTDKSCVLYVEKADDDKSDFRVASKDFIKSLSE